MRTLAMSVLTMVALFAAAGRANAYTVSWNVGSGSRTTTWGSYLFTLTSTDNVNYQYSLVGNADGNGSGGPSAGVPKHAADLFDLVFYDSLWNPIAPVSASGSTSAGAGLTGGNWLTTVDDGVRLASTDGDTELGAFGGNVLNGTVTLANADVSQVTVAGQGGGQLWFGTGQTAGPRAPDPAPLAPEPVSLALVRPAILPLGWLASRRLSRSGAS